MKRLLILIVCLTGCATTMPSENPVCPQEGSWICQKSEELGVSPEQVYGWIYDAAAIAAIADIVQIQEICDYEQQVADWYLKFYPISYTTLINEMLSRITEFDPQKMMLIMNILNKNFVAYKSPALISAADDIILRKGHVQFRRDMLCY